ncbi:MAG: hypothetical protein ACR2RF_29140 [Geminicoccaceae bacterium]
MPRVLFAERYVAQAMIEANRRVASCIINVAISLRGKSMAAAIKNTGISGQIRIN